jgi:hypothetical protein
VPYLYQSYPPDYVIDAAASAVKAAIDDAARLGLTWRIIPGSIVGRNMNDPMATRVVLDGDVTAVRAVSMVGAVRAGQRAWCVQVPPGGLYVMGVIGTNMAMPTTQVFTTVGASTWTKPTGLVYADVTVTGGGGGSGGAVTTAAGESSMGGGGGGGATVRARIAAAALPATVTVTVAAGGTAGAATAGVAGGTGGTSSFGALLTAGGGGGGVCRAASIVMHGADAGNGSNTIGGTVTGILHSGTAGVLGWGGDNGLGISGGGGASHLGGGGRGQRTTAAGQGLGGLGGRNYGGGAAGSINSGGVTGRVGAAGAQGIVFVEEYY